MGCRLLLGHADVVLALDVSKGGHLIASASKDATVSFIIYIYIYMYIYIYIYIYI